MQFRSVLSRGRFGAAEGNEQSGVLFSVSQCYPCARAMLSFCVSLQFYRMVSVEYPNAVKGNIRGFVASAALC